MELNIVLVLLLIVFQLSLLMWQLQKMHRFNLSAAEIELPELDLSELESFKPLEIDDYRIITGDTQDDFTATVKMFAMDGWDTCGGISFIRIDNNKYHFAQALVKVKEED